MTRHEPVQIHRRGLVRRLGLGLGLTSARHGVSASRSVLGLGLELGLGLGSGLGLGLASAAASVEAVANGVGLPLRARMEHHPPGGCSLVVSTHRSAATKATTVATCVDAAGRGGQ